ncbi:hypothetical protein CY34DRAFT_809166, partial [Suillus luteus UH-Slu-Lm8-n1]
MCQDVIAAPHHAHQVQALAEATRRSCVLAGRSVKKFSLPRVLIICVTEPL